MKGYIERLRDAIRGRHGCDSLHVVTIPLTDQFQGRILWQGEVEAFDLRGHPTASRCYAWAYLDDDDREQYAAVLEAPPVNSPRSAVRVALAAQERNGEMRNQKAGPV